MAASANEWDCSDNDLPLDDEYVAGIRARKTIADDFLKSLASNAEQTLTNPHDFQALLDLVDQDVPRMLREIVSLRARK